MLPKLKIPALVIFKTNMNVYCDGIVVCVILEVRGTVMNQLNISLSLTLNINHSYKLHLCCV